MPLTGVTGTFARRRVERSESTDACAERLSLLCGGGTSAWTARLLPLHIVERIDRAERTLGGHGRPRPVTEPSHGTRLCLAASHGTEGSDLARITIPVAGASGTEVASWADLTHLSLSVVAIGTGTTDFAGPGHSVTDTVAGVQRAVTQRTFLRPVAAERTKVGVDTQHRMHGRVLAIVSTRTYRRIARLRLTEMPRTTIHLYRGALWTFVRLAARDPAEVDGVVGAVVSRATEWTVLWLAGARSVTHAAGRTQRRFAVLSAVMTRRTQVEGIVTHSWEKGRKCFGL